MWLFDTDANAHVRYKATRIRAWSDSMQLTASNDIFLYRTLDRRKKESSSSGSSRSVGGGKF